MEAKDTVMDRKQLDEIADASGEECLDFVHNAIKAQAEISFKAGEKQERERINTQVEKHFAEYGGWMGTEDWKHLRERK